MSDAMQFWMVWVGIPLAVIAIWLLAVAVGWAVEQAEAATAHWHDRHASRRAHAAEQSMHKQDDQAFLDWLAVRMGTGSLHGGLDDIFVEAQQQSEIIRILVEKELPKAARRCLETHRLTARVAGAYHFAEVASEPHCHRLRSGMVWLLDHTVRFIESYPMLIDDPRLLHNVVVLRRGALASCRHCPLIDWPVNGSPRLCPTAELVQVRDLNGVAHG